MAGKKKKRSRTEPTLGGTPAGAGRKPAKRKGAAKGRSARSRASERGLLARALRFVLYWGMVAAVWGGVSTP